MNKTIFGGALALLAMFQPAVAGPDGTHWDGAIVVHSVTPSCIDSKEFSFKSSLRPGGLQNNSATHTYLSLSWYRGAASFELPKGKARGNYVVTGVSTKGHPFHQSGPSSKFVKFRTIPRVITRNTPYVSIEITLQNMWGVGSCTAVLRGSYTADPFN